MGQITDERVAEVNDSIAQATTTAAAFRILDGLTRTMVDRLLDLNGEDVTSSAWHGVGLVARREWVARAHGWHAHYREDDRPADGHGPCDSGFDSHSRRPWECRHCGRRPIDHRRAR